MTYQQISNAIESEPLDIHGQEYVWHRDYTDSALHEALENGDPVATAREYLAACRRSILHSLEEINAPEEIIEAVFAPNVERTGSPDGNLNQK